MLRINEQTSSMFDECFGPLGEAGFSGGLLRIGGLVSVG